MRRATGALLLAASALAVFMACAREEPAHAPSRPRAGTTLYRAKRSGNPEPAHAGAPTPGTSAPPEAPEESSPPEPLDGAYEGKRAVSVLRGEASYYGDSLAGHRTANGERYDPRGFTAAHRSLPFGTVLRVVRVDTRAAVVVRVTDRGPYGSRRRILDLSRAAAERLGMIRRGVADVRAEVLEYGKKKKR